MNLNNSHGILLLGQLILINHKPNAMKHGVYYKNPPYVFTQKKR